MPLATRHSSTSGRPSVARRAGCRYAGALLLSLMTLTAAGAGTKAPVPDCPAPRLATGQGVDRFGDPVLADGTVIALAGLAEAPGVAVEARRAALAPLVAGATLTVQALGDTPDRYGRLPALLGEVQGGLAQGGLAQGRLVQEALLEQGLALARPIAGTPACVTGLWDRLVAAEAPARAARRGAWASLPRPAGDVAALATDAGHFSVVSGRVLTVGNRTRLAYLNFGQVWREDTTVRIDGRLRDSLARAGTPVTALAGRVVTLRGDVYEDGGPALDVDRMEQVEGMREAATP